ncbi:hypothetical protein BBJ28_00010741 [Nothophytophthora sp. Chile5]|nr:hypothetical protein BBJ28_00010741 [Nothophytophthora sp. Chile5]
MSGRKSAVPWLDWAEWQEVHAGLFSADVYAQQRAVSRVAAWRSRVQLPVAINATAQLVELQLHEHMAQHHHHAVGVSSRSHMELSLLYASVIVRCVNGLVDGSHKGAYAMAVSALAQRIGIPLWVVDLRHESTHNQLPSLPVLRFAAQHLLAWLRANYWRAQEDAIRSQVYHVAQWLFAQVPHLARQPADVGDLEADRLLQDRVVHAQPESFSQPVLDVDNLRNIVVPLLVFGAQHGERVAPMGLLFLDASGEGCQDASEIHQKDALADLLLQLQQTWRSLGAWLLACLCRKVLDDICPPKPLDAEEDAQEEEAVEGQDARREQQPDTGVALLWIKFLVSNEWREKLKFAAGPMDDLNQCGAEMLVHVEQVKSDALSGDQLELTERLLTALRSNKGIRNHPLLATMATNQVDVSASSGQGWTLLSGWTACPVGIRYCYAGQHGFRQSQVREFSMDDDSVTPDSTAFVVPDEDEDEGNEDITMVADDAERAMDALMEDLDTAYDLTLQQTLDLQSSIARDGLRQGGSAKVLPQQELQRIQDEIEIW